ncbi:hypothetical protein [Amycolatopsis sp. NPDC049868]|uniref:hypothetical protein n=1 Tax=Amycolatopsis sp. NPDC049868 TaxID=3363934 RepID=UPI0037A0C73A
MGSNPIGGTRSFHPKSLDRGGRDFLHFGGAHHVVDPFCGYSGVRYLFDRQFDGNRHLVTRAMDLHGEPGDFEELTKQCLRRLGQIELEMREPFEAVQV